MTNNEEIVIEDLKTENKPWGNFTTFIQNTPCTVKKITIKPYSKLSLQYHIKRTEFWYVVNGSAVFQVGDDISFVTVGSAAVVPNGVKHRIITGNEKCTIIEISTGEFDENDIVRLADDYGRV